MSRGNSPTTPFIEIALDGSFIGAAGGIGTYSWKLTEALMRLCGECPTILLQNELPHHIPQYQEQATLFEQRLPSLPANWQRIQTQTRPRLRWLSWTLPRLLQQYNPQVYHALDSVSIPPWGFRNAAVVTVHDIIPITHPQYCRPQDAWGARLLIPQAMRRADTVITDSHYSANQIVERYPKIESKLQVIPCGVDHEYFYPPEDRIELSLEMARTYTFHSPLFLLSVVTLSPRRNLPRLLQAFENYMESSGDGDVCLVIAGCPGWKETAIRQQIESMSNSHRVHFLGFVIDSDLLRLYQSALALVFPSLLEGFGLPVLEAMACGTPVITSKTTALSEVAGQAALTVDPENVEDLTEAIRQITSLEHLRMTLSIMGQARAREFTWETTAERTLGVYRELL